MRVSTADFLKAAENERDYPRTGLSEIAFAGRSNVGKSSMINTLLGRRNLVRTSKTPGRTRKLNFFLINDRLIFVDLPGYGFAAVSAAEKAKWAPMIDTYLRVRQELAGVVVIVDSRRPPTDSDMDLMQYLRRHQIPFIVAATKADKLSRAQMVASERLIQAALGQNVTVVCFSSHSGLGKNELWREIKSLIQKTPDQGEPRGPVDNDATNS